MPVQARQVRVALKQANVHPHVIQMFEAFAEDMAEQRAMILELAKMVDMQSDIMHSFTQGAAKFMESAQERVRKQALPPGVPGVHVGSETIMPDETD